MTESKKFNGDRLKAARIYRGKTISDLSDEVGITRQAISQFEKGVANPSFETLFSLINILDFPKDYFYEEDKNEIKVGNTYFRALLTTNKKDRLSQIEKIKVLAKIYKFLDGYIEFPELNLPTLNDINSIEAVAREVREYWGLGNEPINNMVKLLEKNGLIISSFSTEGTVIDAFSQQQRINGQEHYFIVLGNDKKSATRRNFDAAHELGHILLHDWSYDMEQVSREDFRKMEKEANQFAAELLLPREPFLNDLIYENKLEYYVELKKKWKVSVAAMIMRAYQLERLNNNQYQYMMKQLIKRGWKTKEPLDNVLKIPNPTVIRKAIELLITNDVLTGDEILQQLSKQHLTLNRSEVELLLGLEKDTLVSKKESNPVISIKKDMMDN